jgi:hypothetical protein
MRNPRKKRPRTKKTAVSGSGKRRSSSPRWIGKIADLTRELNLSERRIYQLAKEGLPKTAPGRYDVIACFRWYVRYLQRKLIERALPEDGDGDAGGPATSTSAMRHKMVAIEVELAQISLAEKREQLVSIEKAAKDIEAIVIEIRTRILALPPRLAAEVLGETDLAVSQVKIDRSLKDALEALSQFDPDDVTRRVDGREAPAKRGFASNAVPQIYPR